MKVAKHGEFGKVNQEKNLFEMTTEMILADMIGQENVENFLNDGDSITMNAKTR